MASRQSLEETEIYFSPKEQVLEALRQRDSDLKNVEEDPEYGEILTDPIDPVYSNVPDSEYCEYDDSEDEYVPPQNREETNETKLGVNPRPKTKRDVEDLYDEDHYALPDIKGCITKDKRGPKVTHGEKQPETSSEGKERKLSSKKRNIAAFLLLLELSLQQLRRNQSPTIGLAMWASILRSIVPPMAPPVPKGLAEQASL